MIKTTAQVSPRAMLIFFLLSACATAQENQAALPTHIENTLGMKFVLIPSGSFSMVFYLAAARYWPQWQGMALQTHDAFSFTSPVGTFKPNHFDLYDMHGNVWEWVSDWHADDYYKNSPASDPGGPVQSDLKVRRGGSWHTWPLYVRCLYRNCNAPTTRYTLLGVRLLREIP